ncbi:hypothetical protein [Streptomyces cavernicola]|uniref:DNA primase/polymerase bifunctional N-terminal domain-containing protein n=1 Tax=Streptomyces cavernicola TaxID=3043613 RepID=A0ABT6SK74_9ACTN|nr:hypothetical protein [Streptomyces sp. B-S-A6]MDI3407828.1 hypothetical protein [Streptomyces sp. B-S-A6]
MNSPTAPPWLPASGIQLRKAGVQFDAVRVDGDLGRRLADTLERMTGGSPGPVVVEERGRRSVYFLVPVGSTAHRAWPVNATRLTAGPGLVSYIPVPVLNSWTWPLSWRCRPCPMGGLVHPLLLRTVLAELNATV